MEDQEEFEISKYFNCTYDFI
jgi:hypothetical protein